MSARSLHVVQVLGTCHFAELMEILLGQTMPINKYVACSCVLVYARVLVCVRVSRARSFTIIDRVCAAPVVHSEVISVFKAMVDAQAADLQVKTLTKLISYVLCVLACAIGLIWHLMALRKLAA